MPLHGLRVRNTVVGLLLLAPAVGAQQPCASVSILVSALDEQDLPYSGLQSASFQVRIGGKPAKVLAVQEEAARRRVVVLLDASPSMRDDSTGKWTLARVIAAHIIQNGPSAGVPLAAYFGKVERKPDGSASLETIDRPQNTVDWRDLTAGLAVSTPRTTPPPLFDALSEGVALLGQPRSGDVVFVVTDGGEEGSTKKPAALLAELIQAGVRLYAVTLPTRYDIQLMVYRSPMDADALRQKENTDFLNTIHFSGGALLRIHPNRRTNEWGFKFTDEERLRMATSLQLLYLQAARAYRLDVEPPGGARSSGLQKLDVDIVAAPAQTRLTLKHAKSVPVCPAGK